MLATRHAPPTVAGQPPRAKGKSLGIFPRPAQLVQIRQVLEAASGLIGNDEIGFAEIMNITFV
jgi:hypothetical protein